MIGNLILDKWSRVAIARQNESSHIVVSGGRAHKLLDLIEQSKTEFLGTNCRRALQPRFHRIQSPLFAAALGFYDSTRNQHQDRPRLQSNRGGVAGAMGE